MSQESRVESNFIPDDDKGAQVTAPSYFPVKTKEIRLAPIWRAFRRVGSESP